MFISDDELARTPLPYKVDVVNFLRELVELQKKHNMYLSPLHIGDLLLCTLDDDEDISFIDQYGTGFELSSEHYGNVVVGKVRSNHDYVTMEGFKNCYSCGKPKHMHGPPEYKEETLIEG